MMLPDTFALSKKSEPMDWPTGKPSREKRRSKRQGRRKRRGLDGLAGRCGLGVLDLDGQGSRMGGRPERFALLSEDQASLLLACARSFVGEGCQ
ncbi:hypothetical protein MTYM_01241 [Methylococcales bacterium]|nr:hypothetical protein MTYM_01241 [Methylococcales bacterium]